MQPIQNLSQQKSEVRSTPLTKEKLTFNRLECVFSYVMPALGFCFVRYVLWNITGLFTTLFFWIMAFTCLFYLTKSHYKLYKNHILQFTIILIFSVVFSITANNLIKLLDACFLFALGIYWVYSVCKGNQTIERFFFFDLLKATIIMPFHSFGKVPQALSYSASKSRLGNNIKFILIGFVVTIPVTLLVVTLLISADSGVEKILHLLFGDIGENAAVIFVQFLIGIPIALYTFGMLYSNVLQVKKEVLTFEKCESDLKNAQKVPNMILYSSVTPVCALYVIFFISQMQYFISAFQGILPQPYSYAQYARKGFFELLSISIINLMIILVISFLPKQTGEHKPVMLKFYSVLLSVFTISIIATALSKMILYIQNFGLTPLRIYTSWFMILLLLLFVLIIIKQFNFHFCFAKYSVYAFVFLFGILCFSKVDGIIAKYNVEMFQSGQLNSLDIESLCNLSDDALVYLLEQGIDTKDYLDHKLKTYNDIPYSTYNLSSWKVKGLLE